MLLSISVITAGFSDLKTAHAASKIKLSKSTATLTVGNSLTLKLVNAKSSSVKWSSSKSSIASVNSKGKVTAKKKGTTTIKATYMKKTYCAKIKVKSSRITEKQLTLRVGYGYSLNVVNTTAKATWKSSDSSVARINANGYVSPLQPGTSTITAKVKSETYSCKLKVVEAFGENDFLFDSPTEEGYTNYIDYSTAKGSSWYWYWTTATTTGNENRGVHVGDTYSDVISAYGYQESAAVLSSDKYSKYFKTNAYPRTSVEYVYRYDQKDYYKKFYLDKDNTLVLIVWHR